MPELAAIRIHPVKSCAAIDCERCALDELGLAGDRRWQIIDADGGMLTQRDEPRLALIRPELMAGSLFLHAPGTGSMPVPAAGPPRRVRCWTHEGEAADCGDPAAAWLSGFLGRAVRLVAWGRAQRRPIPPGWHAADALTAFTDGFPLLVLSRAAVADLSTRVGRVLDERRFRANLVIAGCAAHAEDGWKRIRIGAVELALVKPCSRCVVTTVDPATGARDGDGEPLRSLARYRRRDGKVLFAQNAVHAGPGELRVGDAVEVLETA